MGFFDILKKGGRALFNGIKNVVNTVVKHSGEIGSLVRTGMNFYNDAKQLAVNTVVPAVTSLVSGSSTNARYYLNGPEEEETREMTETSNFLNKAYQDDPVNTSVATGFIKKMYKTISNESSINTPNNINYGTVTTRYKYKLNKGDEIIGFMNTSPFVEKLKKNTRISYSKPVGNSVTIRTIGGENGAGVVVNKVMTASSLKDITNPEKYQMIGEMGSTSNNNNKVCVNTDSTLTQVITEDTREVVRRYKHEVGFTKEESGDFLKRIKVLYGHNVNEKGMLLEDIKDDGQSVIKNIEKIQESNETQPRQYYLDHGAGRIEDGKIVGSNEALFDTTSFKVDCNSDNVDTEIVRDIGYIESDGIKSSDEEPDNSESNVHVFTRELIMLHVNDIRELMYKYKEDKEDKKAFTKELIKIAIKTAPFRRRYPVFKRGVFARFANEDDELEDDEEIEIPRAKLIFI